MTKINKFALWQAVLSNLRGIVHESLHSELADLGQIDRIDAGRVTIAILSQAVIEQCEGVYQEDFDTALSELLERKVTVTFLYDKKRLWQNILDDLCDDMDTGLYYSLQEKAYIERIEPDKVVIGVFSQAIKTQCEKRYRFKIANAFKSALGRKVDIVFAEAAPRLYVDLPFEDKPKEVREAILHGDHGDIMTIVDNDPLFQKVALPLEEGGWGMNPKKLTNDCKDYGVVRRESRSRYCLKPRKEVIETHYSLNGSLPKQARLATVWSEAFGTMKPFARRGKVVRHSLWLPASGG